MRILIILTIFCSLNLKAEKLRINADWQFQRLENKQEEKEIANQGNDWSSQYNIEHVRTDNKLQLSSDTVKKEFDALERGNWQQVRLPHTPYIEDMVVLHQWQGICYYKRKLTIPARWRDRQLWLEFEGAMHLADIWINGTHAVQHAGGYLPFVVEMNEFLKPGEEQEILVRLDNRDNPLIPPGKPVNKLDFCYYGGLYRDVNLIVKPLQHITHPILSGQIAGGGIFVTYPEVSKEKARITVHCEISNKDKKQAELTIRHTLYKMDGLWGKNKKGKSVAVDQQPLILPAGESRSLKAGLAVNDPALWSPDAPNLYLLATEILKDGKTIDTEETKIGIRRIEMDKKRGFLINGEPLRLVGSNRHMEYPYVGNAISDNAQYRDIYQIKTNGFNIVRLGHYPQDKSVLEACDELGLMAIEPTPGWQFFNKDTLFTELTYRDIRHMIRRDRNHPSVVMWEVILNESWPPVSWKDGAVRTAHEEYPGDQCFTSGDTYGYHGFDVSYNDWEEGYKRPNDSPNPGFIREYYDYEFGGHHSTTRIIRAQGEKALLQNAWNAQWSHNRYRKQYPATMGDAVWSMYDYNRGCCDNICYSGVADVFRLPKYSLRFFASQPSAGTPLPGEYKKAELFIANRWDMRSGKSDTVVVYGNVDEVELKINGKTLKRQKADNGKDTEYIETTDGGNCQNLTSPPFTFTGVKWENGILQAIGYKNGKKMAETEVRTPAQPEQLEISYFESGKPAECLDLLIVYVNLKDKNGIIVPENGHTVTLQVTGGKIKGPEKYDTEAGIAAFLVETGDDAKLQLMAGFGAMRTTKTIKLK